MIRVFLILLLLTTKSLAWTDEAIVRAIYLAEGGSHAEFPYGIRSIQCQGTECRDICWRTVKNNRKRFEKYGYKKHPDFITFLGSRYCPTQGRSLSKAEQKLNGNWVKNVNYFLEKEVTCKKKSLQQKCK